MFQRTGTLFAIYPPPQQEVRKGRYRNCSGILSTMFSAQLISPERRFVNTAVFTVEILYNIGELTFGTACIFVGYAC